MAYRPLATLSFVLVLWLSACDSDPTQKFGSTTASLNVLDDANELLALEDDSDDGVLRDLALDFPGFGGFHTRGGTLHILHNGAGSTEGLEEAVRTTFDIRSSQVQFVESEYDFAQLYVWKRVLRESINTPYNFIDIDESKAQIFISAPDVQAVDELMALGQSLGISGNALVVQRGKPFRGSEAATVFCEDSPTHPDCDGPQ